MDEMKIPLDKLLYTLGTSILLVVAYTLRSGNFERLFGKKPVKSIFRAKTEVPVPNVTELETFNDLRLSHTWWSDEKIFELEKRAIFSKTWLFVTHASRFQKPGDYRTFEISGFSFVVILGKDKKIRTFHNVCRHRAYAVTKKESGSSTVLGCRYHGWSYDTKGKLVKAPEFDKVPGFNRDMNGLWEINTSIVQSMVFVNFDAAAHVERLALGDIETRLEKWGVSKLKCLEDWKIEGAFNWKLLGTLIRQEEKAPFWSARLPFTTRTSPGGLELGHSSTVRRIAPGVVLVLRAVPKSATSTTVECSIYANERQASMDGASLKSEVNWDIKQLAIKQQRIMCNQEPIMSLASSIAPQGELNRLLGNHIDAEKKAGEEIHPAAREKSFSQEGKADDDCKKVLQNLKFDLVQLDTDCNSLSRA